VSTTGSEPTFTVGIEEEYKIVDLATGDLVRDLPDGMMERIGEAAQGQVGPEFMRSQIEVGTPVCGSIGELRTQLARLRLAVATEAGRHDLAPISASTHPSAAWTDQINTDKERYNALAEAMGGVARRLLISGMHVHVGVEDEELRIDLMNQVSYFMPHLLAISTSSPFWHGIETGLKSYRTSVFRAVPRTGLPDEFTSWSDYRRHVTVLVEAGVIEDATRLWWDLRPSDRYPTLEMRASDICTNIDDGMTVAAMYLSLLRMLYRRRKGNQRWRTYSRMLLSENMWRAQRYGTSAGLIDFGKGTIVPYAELYEEILELVADDAAEIGCTAELEHGRTILERGTSADRQLAVYHEALDQGAEAPEALRKVVDFLVEETVAGL
jgi:carboxylate-amine ligase